MNDNDINNFNFQPNNDNNQNMQPLNNFNQDINNNQSMNNGVNVNPIEPQNNINPMQNNFVPNMNNNQMYTINNQPMNNGMHLNPTEPQNNFNQGMNNNQPMNALNNQQSNQNMQPLNNFNQGFNNQNFQPNNVNNPQNINTNQRSTQPKGSLIEKLKNKKILGIVIGVIVVIIALSLFKGAGSSLGGGKNTTGSTQYSASDVEASCVLDISEGNTIEIIYSDVIFNEKNGAQAKVYNKKVLKRKDGAKIETDKYKEIIKENINPIAGTFDLTEEDYNKEKLELDITTYGYDTIIYRYDNKLEITWFNIYGTVSIHGEASNADKKEFIEELEKQGYSCK